MTPLMIKRLVTEVMVMPVGFWGICLSLYGKNKVVYKSYRVLLEFSPTGSILGPCRYVKYLIQLDSPLFPVGFFLTVLPSRKRVTIVCFYNPDALS